MAADSLRDPSAEPVVDSSAPATPRPAMGERSRQYLRDRQQGRPRPDDPGPVYRVPALEQKGRPSVAGAIILLHFLFGIFWAIGGMIICMAFATQRPVANGRGALGGLGVMVYGGFCCVLAVALSATVPWARSASLALSVLWIGVFIYLMLPYGPFAFFGAALPGFILWGLIARKAAFIEAD
ncbi:MAG TPA: hypothetical protein VGE07_26750 [Herpetosiphonaceae bacterium]